ncbi:MAG: hypothetical protein F4106_03070 [Gemmatimonadetes bacterium]|nr:hypothetical protein [Gemmatimonadota bacterium]MYC91691.1 hypothetical protein [Gemmatimonadota bacterium]MYG36559.1 hypothetical protein [Gemmatimonadota bacterium]MYJ17021.1 hypothetical protein [Gemmatimonadota bacterium]
MKRQWLAGGVFLLLVLATGACDWLDDPSPEFVRVMIESDDDALMLITSTQFVQTTNEFGETGVQVFDSDTTIASFPFDQSWNIKDEQRFLLMGFAPDSSAVMVRMRILLDGDLDYDKTVIVLIDDPVRYIYLFNQQILQDFELL